MANVPSNLPDSTLASNWCTAFVPNPLNFRHNVAHFFNSGYVGVKRLFRAKTVQNFDGLRPGDVAPRKDVNDLNQVGAAVNEASESQKFAREARRQIRSRETRSDLPLLPPSAIPECERYFACQAVAPQPYRTNPREKNKVGALLRLIPGAEDAFHSKTDDGQHILPDCVRNSSLLNTYTEGLEDLELLPGQPHKEVINNLSDSKTGFVAGIVYDRKSREVIISFPGVGASGMPYRQLFRCGLNWCGLTTKNMLQASKLTRLVKQHIDQLNEKLKQKVPPEQQIKLTLTGHSMGGGLATFAALRNSVSAVVFNPMRLGWGARARCTQDQLDQADKYVTEIVVQGDYLSDNHLAKLYIPLKGIGFNLRGPVGNARRFMLPNNGVDDRHVDVPEALGLLKRRQQRLQACFANSKFCTNSIDALHKTSPRAQGDMYAGDVRQAVKETVTAALDETLMGTELTPQEQREIHNLANKLPDLVQQLVFLSNDDNMDQIKSDLIDVFDALHDRLIPFPDFLEDLRFNFVDVLYDDFPSAEAARLTQPDSTLASNAITAFVPNPLNLRYNVAHFFNSSYVGLKRLFRARTGRTFDSLRPPGDVAPRKDANDLGQVGNQVNGAPEPQNIARATVPKMRSRETWNDLPLLPVEQCDEAKFYFNCQDAASNPDPTRSDFDAFFDGHDPALGGLRDNTSRTAEDAFLATTEDGRHILPSSVRNSSLLNTYTSYDKNLKKGILLKPGQRDKRVVNQLSDRKTGFAAGISYHPARREVVIGFPNALAAGMQGRQLFRGGLNWCGLTPKNMLQASKLTRLVKQHIDHLNENLPPEKQIKLTLTGHSMGGGLATFAALRNSVSAVVFNPMRLGWGARARCTQDQLDQADKYVTEIVVQGDFLSDNHLAKLYIPLKAIGFNLRGPVGNARRFMLPNNGVDSRHMDVPEALHLLKRRQKRLQACFANSIDALHKTSARAQGDMYGRDVRRAVKEATASALKELLKTAEKPERVLNQAAKIPDLVQRIVFPVANSKPRQASKDLKKVLDSIEKDLGGLPVFLATLRTDLRPRSGTPRASIIKKTRSLFWDSISPQSPAESQQS